MVRGVRAAARRAGHNRIRRRGRYSALINGKYDSILPVATAQDPFFQRLGTPAADKRHVVLDAGHSVETPETHTALLKAVLDWLDKYLQ